MSYTSTIINRALHKMQGTIGQMITSDLRRQGLKKAQVKAWVKNLREAADILEELL